MTGKSKMEDKGIVFTFGRFQPFTLAHLVMLNHMNAITDEKGYEMKIFASHSQDQEKNPLDYDDKINFMRLSVPKKYKLAVEPSKAKTIYDVLEQLRAEGYTKAIMVVGSDRVDDFTHALKPYIKKMGWKSFIIQSAGKRDPDSDDAVESMSSSFLRDAASKGNFKDFRNGLSDFLTDDQKKDLFKLLRKGMGVRENK